MPTFTTRLPEQLFSFLDAHAELMSRMEREMFVRLQRGERIGVLEKELQVKYDCDSTTVRNVYHNLKGKIDGAIEVQKYRVKELKHAIQSIEKAIQKHEKRLKQSVKKGLPTWEIHHTIHQKKRRLHIKQTKLKQLEANLDAGKVSMCFGSKKLFNAQHHLDANGYETHEEWREDWRLARSSNYLMVGSKIYQGGNQLCRLTSEGKLTITVPRPLVKQFGGSISVEDVTFRYGQCWIDAALQPVRRFSDGKVKSSRIGTEAPVTHRFVRKDGEWFIHTHVSLPEIPYISHRKNGAIGIDLNVDSIAWAHCDSEGNLKAHGQIAIDLKDKSSNQSQDILSNALDQIVMIAIDRECPIVIERLDFSEKKAGLREQGARYAEMLSQFAYAKFSELLEGKCSIQGIELIRQNPAYSSLIGMHKFMGMYGLNSGTAAAFVLARRGLRLSERLTEALRTFVSPVDDTKHVWSYWRRAAKLLVGVRRHSYFALKVRVEVNPNESISLGKSKDTSAIPSEVGALASWSGKLSYAQLCLDFS